MVRSSPHSSSAAVAVVASAAALASVVALLAACPHNAKPAADEPVAPASDSEEWPRDVCGIWRVAFTSHSGPPVAAPPGHLWLFDHQKRLLIWADSNNESAVAFKVVFTNGNHRQIDLIPWQEEQVFLRAIYEVSQDKLRVCGGPRGGTRPTDFDIAGADHHTTFLEHVFSPFGEALAKENQE